MGKSDGVVENVPGGTMGGSPGMDGRVVGAGGAGLALPFF